MRTEDRRFTLILPPELRDALRRRARADANSEAATARRLLARALAEEPRQVPEDARTPEDAA